MKENRAELNLARLPDEDEYEYIYRICSLKDVIGTWEEVSKVLNAELGYEYTESKYRKQYQSFLKLFSANQERLQPSNYADTITERTRELNRERMKLQTEKLEYNRWLREHSRDELIMERIVDEIRALPSLKMEDYRCLENIAADDENFKDDEEVIFKSEPQVGILCYGDEHFGAEFEIKGLHGEIINSYSPEIYMNRMNEMLLEVLSIVAINGLDKIKIYSLGDELDGIIRVSQLSKLRYGVIESALRYSEFICQWLAQICAFVDVEFHMTEGNHSELRMLGQPKGTFTEENMSRIVKQFIKVRMEDNPHFTMVENETGLIYDNVFGMNILGIHGEVKNMTSALKNFCVMYDTPIDILIGGHMHHYAAETVGVNKDVVNVPSIMGVDPYSIKIAKTSNAGASFFILKPDKGITQQHNIKF